MPRRVSVTQRARHEFLSLFYWIASRSPDGAARWADAFHDAVERLATNPDGYGVAPESRRHPETIRQFFFKTRRGRTYRALFVIRDEQVFVLHVRGPRQRIMRRDEIEEP